MNKKNRQKILVTGGSGFIGSAITNYLVKNGHSVTVFDNNSRGKLRRLKDVLSKIKFKKGDIRDYKKLQSIGGNFDTVIHLAYVNGTKFFYEKPQDVLDVSIKGILAVMEACKKNKIKNIIFSDLRIISGMTCSQPISGP